MANNESTVIINLNNKKMEYKISKNLGQDYAISTFSGAMGIIAEGISGVSKKTGYVVDITDGIVTGIFDSELNPEKELSHILGTAASAFLIGQAFSSTLGKIGLFIK